MEIAISKKFIKNNHDTIEQVSILDFLFNLPNKINITLFGVLVDEFELKLCKILLAQWAINIAEASFILCMSFDIINLEQKVGCTQLKGYVC